MVMCGAGAYPRLPNPTRPTTSSPSRPTSSIPCTKHHSTDLLRCRARPVVSRAAIGRRGRGPTAAVGPVAIGGSGAVGHVLRPPAHEHSLLLTRLVLLLSPASGSGCSAPSPVAKCLPACCRIGPELDDEIRVCYSSVACNPRSTGLPSPAAFSIDRFIEQECDAVGCVVGLWLAKGVDILLWCDPDPSS